MLAMARIQLSSYYRTIVLMRLESVRIGNILNIDINLNFRLEQYLSCLGMVTKLEKHYDSDR